MTRSGCPPRGHRLTGTALPRAVARIPTPRHPRRCDDGFTDLTAFPALPARAGVPGRLRAPHLPGRPARSRRPALPPPLLQPQGVPARTAAERRGRDHRPARRAAGRPGDRAAAHRGRRTARDGLRHRAHRTGGAPTPGHHRPQLQARGRTAGRARRLPRPVRHRTAGLLRGRRPHPRGQPQRPHPRRGPRGVDGHRRRVLHRAHPPRRGAPRAGHHRAPGGTCRCRRLAHRGTGAVPGPRLRHAAALRRPRGRRGGHRTARPLGPPPLLARRPPGRPGPALPRPVRLHPARLHRPRRAAGRRPRRGLRPAHRRQPRPAGEPPRAPEGHAAHRARRATPPRLGVLRALRARHGQPAPHRLPRVPLRGRHPGRSARGPRGTHPLLADRPRRPGPRTARRLPLRAPPRRQVPRTARHRDAAHDAAVAALRDDRRPALPGGVRPAPPGRALHPHGRGVPPGRAHRLRPGHRRRQRRLHLRQRPGRGAALGATRHGGRRTRLRHGHRAPGRRRPGRGTRPVRLPHRRARRPGPAGLRRRPARLPPPLRARAAPRRPHRPPRTGPRRGRGTGRRPVGRHPRLPARQRAPGPPRAQPPQPAGPPHRHPRRGRTHRHRRRIPVRTGAAARPAPLRPADSALLNRAFLGLLEWATHTDTPEGGAR